MKESRYNEGVGGFTDGRFRRDQYSGSGSRQFEFERESEHGLSGGTVSGFEFDEDVKWDGGVEFFGGDRSDEREFNGRLGLAGVGDPGRSFGQGVGDPFADLARDLSSSSECGSGQNSGQPAELAGAAPVATAGSGAAGGLAGGPDHASELAALISEASSALSHLDAPALEELGRKAEALSTLNLGSSGVKDRALIPVLEARFRVFSALLKATGENLATLQRAETYDPLNTQTYGPRGSEQAGVPRGLFESFGMYDDADVNGSIWPANAVPPAFSALPETNPKKDRSGKA